MMPRAAAYAPILAFGLAAAWAAPAYADGYLSGYSGGGYRYLSGYSSGYGRVLSHYSSGGYSGGRGYSMASFGSGSGWSDTPHRSTWRGYSQELAAYNARAYATAPCGTYHARPLACRQVTTRWKP